MDTQHNGLLFDATIWFRYGEERTTWIDMLIAEDAEDAARDRALALTTEFVRQNLTDITVRPAMRWSPYLRKFIRIPYHRFA